MNNGLHKLQKPPRVKRTIGIGFPFNISFMEKKTGERDSKENQIRSFDDGERTPWLSARTESYEKYVNSTYAYVIKETEEPIQEASKLLTELNTILGTAPLSFDGDDEESIRQRRLEAARQTKRDERKEELLIKLTEIKEFIENADEKLLHHIEMAGNILSVHTSNYWRGILKVSGADVRTVTPVLEFGDFEGRTKYEERKKILISRIDQALERGGCADEKDE